MKPWQHILLGVFLGIIATTGIGLVTSSPRGKAILIKPPPTQSPIIVYVTGAVLHPGIYSLNANSRTNEAIIAAGGVLSDSDIQAINLAMPIKDGDKIFVPLRGNTLPTSVDSTNDQNSRITSNGNENPNFSSTNPLNINTASQQDLESLPEIGPSLASAIIRYRELNGPFKTIEDIDNVPGIGPAIYEAIKEYIIVY